MEPLLKEANDDDEENDENDDEKCLSRQTNLKEEKSYRKNDASKLRKSRRPVKDALFNYRQDTVIKVKSNEEEISLRFDIFICLVS